jgi:3-oxoacyl-[acyl-carrier-protein] synthase-3
VAVVGCSGLVVESTRDAEMMGGPGASIVGIEVEMPARVVTNAELDAAHPGWRMAEVVRRTGVESRRWCGPDETALDLAVAACRRLLERTGTPPTTVDAILFCTQSPDYVMPPNACILQARLGVSRATAAFDFSLACSGFVYGLYLAKALIESGAAKRVLLVTAETYSKLFNHDDRGPATLFGDGAAATLIVGGEVRIGRVLVGTDGASPDVFCVPAGGARTPRTSSSAMPQDQPFGGLRSPEQIVMDGAAVLAFVQRDLVGFVREALTEFDTTLDGVDLVVFHQASKAALDILAMKLDIPDAKMFRYLAHVGNTVSASIPMALRAAEDQRRLVKGMRVLVVGFGVGLSWGACIITW